MARPKIVNPKGKTKDIRIRIAEPVAQSMEREAKKRGVSVAQIVRERLAQVA